MSGEIEVESRVGTGTLFHLYFPKTDEALVAAAPVAAADLRGSENILVVEDQENVRTLIVTALKAIRIQRLERRQCPTGAGVQRVA